MSRIDYFSYLYHRRENYRDLQNYVYGEMHNKFLDIETNGIVYKYKKINDSEVESFIITVTAGVDTCSVGVGKAYDYVRSSSGVDYTKSARKVEINETDVTKSYVASNPYKYDSQTPPVAIPDSTGVKAIPLRPDGLGGLLDTALILRYCEIVDINAQYDSFVKKVHGYPNYIDGYEIKAVDPETLDTYMTDLTAGWIFLGVVTSKKVVLYEYTTSAVTPKTYRRQYMVPKWRVLNDAHLYLRFSYMVGSGASANACKVRLYNGTDIRLIEKSNIGTITDTEIDLTEQVYLDGGGTLKIEFVGDTGGSGDTQIVDINNVRLEWQRNGELLSSIPLNNYSFEYGTVGDRTVARAIRGWDNGTGWSGIRWSSDPILGYVLGLCTLGGNSGSAYQTVTLTGVIGDLGITQSEVGSFNSLLVRGKTKRSIMEISDESDGSYLNAGTTGINAEPINLSVKGKIKADNEYSYNDLDVSTDLVNKLKFAEDTGTDIEIKFNNDAGVDKWIEAINKGTGTGGGFRWYNASSEQMRLDFNGNLLLGVTLNTDNWKESVYRISSGNNNAYGLYVNSIGNVSAVGKEVIAVLGDSTRGGSSIVYGVYGKGRDTDDGFPGAIYGVYGKSITENAGDVGSDAIGTYGTVTSQLEWSTSTVKAVGVFGEIDFNGSTIAANNNAIGVKGYVDVSLVSSYGANSIVAAVYGKMNRSIPDPDTLFGKAWAGYFDGDVYMKRVLCIDDSGWLQFGLSSLKLSRSGNILSLTNSGGVGTATLSVDGKLAIGKTTADEVLDVVGNIKSSLNADIGGILKVSSTGKSYILGRLSIGKTDTNSGLDVVKAPIQGTIVSGVNFEQTLTAAINNASLTALNINPSFTDAGYTGVKHYGLVLYDSTDLGGDSGFGVLQPIHKVHIDDNSDTNDRAGLFVSQSGSQSAGGYGTGYAGWFDKSGGGDLNIGIKVTSFGATKNLAAWLGDPGNTGAPDNVLVSHNLGIGMSEWDAITERIQIYGNGADTKVEINAGGDAVSTNNYSSLRLKNNIGVGSPSAASWTLQVTKSTGDSPAGRFRIVREAYDIPEIAVIEPLSITKEGAVKIFRTRTDYGDSVSRIADTDGIVFATAVNNTGGGGTRITGFIGGDIVSKQEVQAMAGVVYLSITYPVSKGDEWHVDKVADTLSVHFTPLGYGDGAV